MPISHRAAGLAAFCLLLLAAAPAAAQNVMALDSLVRAFKAAQQPVGLVVGVTDPAEDTRWLLPEGVASRRDSTFLERDTRFEIGSVTKVFTGLLLAEAAERGVVSLDDPIGRYLPDSVRTPTYEGAPIRLRHLAAHTSGLPRLPANLRPADPTDPYADYGPARLYAFLDGYDLPRAPGAEYAYSNLGAGLLGHLLARQAGTTYPALLRERVLAPLQLRLTYAPLPADTAAADEAGPPVAPGYTPPPLAQGYVTPTRPAAYWHFDALAGAGALRSTASDLLRFLTQQLRPDSTALAASIRRTHEARPRAEGGPAMGLGWHVSSLPGGRLYWHNGGTGGFRSFVGFMPEAGRGLVVLANAALPLQPFNQFAFRVARRVQQE